MRVYSWSDFPDKLQLAAEEATRESGDQNGQDAGRFVIAKVLVRQQKIDEAIIVLGQITDPSLVDGAKSYAETLLKKQGEKP
jgi:predicted negative regulator of RcsB-dependent stress response